MAGRVRNRVVNSERDYTELFEDDEFGRFFGPAIVARGWHSTFGANYEPFDADCVRRFYDHIEVEADGVFVTWGQHRYLLNLEVVAEVTGIPLEEAPVNQVADQVSPAVIDSVLLDESQFHRYDNHLQIGWLRKNQGLVAHWVTTNVLGTTRTSQLYREGIHILRVLQEDLPGFCMVRRLFETITSARTTSAPLASLVMSILRYWNAPLPEPLALRAVPRLEVGNAGLSACRFDLWDPEDAAPAAYRPGDLRAFDGLQTNDARFRVLGGWMGELMTAVEDIQRRLDEGQGIPARRRR
jgi:hypothetical protein